MNRFEEALENYDSAMQKNPDDSHHYNGKAITLQKLNRLEEALEHQDSAIQKYPENSYQYKLFLQDILIKKHI
ncbi:unnamed protein product [Paramecium octaurelia]|nr:unnamed protein product [Paramecium octaurelia]